jgi:arginine decarboxylase
MTDWHIRKAREVYNVPYWGGGYFDVNDQGHVIVRPDRNPDHDGLDLFALAAELRAQGLSLPALVRFVDILRDRVDVLCNAFARAMAEDDYRGAYTAVYPIKVNQQRSVVDAIRSHGGPCVGLEAGSKPELLAVLALSFAERGVIVCNGYKDSEYIRLALIGRKLGHRVYIVVEKLSELEVIIRESRAMGIAPMLGLRVRLASIGAGKWQNTGGEKSKFGLSATQVLRVVERLREAGMLDCLQLVHFHLGSQIANIRDIQRGMREAARYYAELRRLGAGVNTMDVGGGLGIDYEGTRSRSFCSINYSVDEYAKNIVHIVWETCAEQDLPHPDIITESGRAMTAHHAVLITNVIDLEQVPDLGSLAAAEDDEPLIISDLRALYEADVNTRSAVEAYHDAAHWLGEAQGMYTHGVLTLEQRARAEELYFAICRKVASLLQAPARSHREVVDELHEKLADKYFCNFSVFQSVPDVWAIEQIFPIMPLHRLDEPPTRRAVLQDVTCDSDGRISYYVDREGIETTLPLHSIEPGKHYLLGLFLVGAYQEILGDMHNLFGDTDSVDVSLTADGGYELHNPRNGDTVGDVLRYVHIEAGELLDVLRGKLAGAALDDEQRAAFLTELEAGLSGYTYLED